MTSDAISPFSESNREVERPTVRFLHHEEGGGTQPRVPKDLIQQESRERGSPRRWPNGGERDMPPHRRKSTTKEYEKGCAVRPFIGRRRKRKPPRSVPRIWKTHRGEEW